MPQLLKVVGAMPSARTIAKQAKQQALPEASSDEEEEEVPRVSISPAKTPKMLLAPKEKKPKVNVTRADFGQVDIGPIGVWTVRERSINSSNQVVVSCLFSY